MTVWSIKFTIQKFSSSDTEAPFLDLHLNISDGFVSSKIDDKRDDFDFVIVNYPFLDGKVPRATSNGVYISQFIRFARVSSLSLTLTLEINFLQRNFSNKVIGITNSVTHFSKFYRRYYDFVSKFNTGLKSLLKQGLSKT